MAPAAVIGRDAELSRLSAFVAAIAQGPGAFVLSGGAGIGKTTVWLEACEVAGRAGVQVLSCRPAEGEQRLAHAGLGDLLAGVPGQVVGRLPGPQRRALAAALLLDEPAGADDEAATAFPPDARAVAAGLLGVVVALAAARPLLVAVDDVQWLDPQTEAAVAFLARRLGSAPVGVLVAERTEVPGAAPLGLDRAPLGHLERLALGPLSLGALHHVLHERIGVGLPRPLLRRVHEAADGNPFYALEIARVLAARGDELAPGAPLPLPPMLGDLVTARLRGLPDASLEALRLVALLGSPALAVVEAAAGGATGIDAALEAGVLELHGQRLRPAHPLLASAANGALPPGERRRLHARLAESLDDVEQRGWHGALAAAGPDAEAAAAVAESAASARARGAPEAAAEMAELAVRLTPADDASARRRRVRAAAAAHLAVGDPARARRLLEALVAALPAGSERAQVLSELTLAGSDSRQAMRLTEQAWAEAGDDPALRARLASQRALFGWLAGDLARSETHCREAVEHAAQAGDDTLLAMAVADLARAEVVLGRSLDRDALERAAAIEESAGIGTVPLELRPSFQLAVLLVYTDALDDARPLLVRHLARETAAGNETARASVLFRVAELELRAGRWTAAADAAAEAVALAEQSSIKQVQAITLAARAAVAAHRGLLETALADAEAALDLAERGGDAMVGLRARGMLGFVELSRGDATAALAQLVPAWRALLEMGVGEPSIHGVADNTLDAFVGTGDLDAARAVVDWLEGTGRPTVRPWALAVAARGRAQLASARGDQEAARQAVAEALAWHAQVPQPFQHARTLLVAGRVELRARRRREARLALEEARGMFATLGAPSWTAMAEAELRRLGGRAAAAGLTDTERRVAALVTEGRSSRDVAAALFVSVRTVDSHLANIYAKLGVRSRTALAHRLDHGGDPHDS